MRLFFIPLIILGLLMAASPGQAAVKVFYTTKDRTYELAAFEDDKLYAIVDGNRTQLPDGGKFSLGGDWPSDVEHVLFAPQMKIFRDSYPDWFAARPAPFDVQVAVRHGGYNYPKGEKIYRDSLLLRQWPAAQFSGKTLALIGWAAEGEVKFVAGRPLVSVDKQWFEEIQRWQMTAAQTGGSGVVVLVGPNGLLTLNPVFAEAAAQAAYRQLATGDEAAFRQSIAASPKLVLARAFNRATLLHFAVLLNRPWAVDVLVAAKADREAVDDEGNTPLAQAAALGRTAAVERLLAVRIDKDAGWPLHEAIRNGHDRIARRLLEAGASISAENNYNETPLVLAIDNNRPVLAEDLLKRGTNYHFDNEQMQRVLLSKCRQGQTALVRLLLGNGVTPAIAVHGMTPLLAAALGGNRELCEMLLKAGSRLNEAGVGGMTPFLAAASGGNLDAMQLLLKAKADPTAATDRSLTAAHLAAKSNNPEALACALDHGVGRDSKDKAGLTPLAFALLSNAPVTARLLFARGAALDPNDASFQLQLDAVLRFDLVEGLDALVHSGWSPGPMLLGQLPLLQAAEIYEAGHCLETLQRVVSAGSGPAFIPLAKSSEVSTGPRLRTKPHPKDPRPEEEEAASTEVAVEVIVDQAGTVACPRVLATPDDRLIPAAIEELRRLRFEPARKDGQPVATRIRFSLTFANERKEEYESKSLDEPPQLKKTVTPVYPDFLRRGGATGKVELEFIIDTHGQVRDIVIVRSPHPAFAEAAANALRQWVFTPGRVHGRAVNTRSIITIPFILQN